MHTTVHEGMHAFPSATGTANVLYLQPHAKPTLPRARDRICSTLPAALGGHLNAFAQTVRVECKTCKCSRKLGVHGVLSCNAQ